MTTRKRVAKMSRTKRTRNNKQTPPSPPLLYYYSKTHASSAWWIFETPNNNTTKMANPPDNTRNCALTTGRCCNEMTARPVKERQANNCFISFTISTIHNKKTSTQLQPSQNDAFICGVSFAPCHTPMSAQVPRTIFSRWRTSNRRNVAGAGADACTPTAGAD